MVKTALPLLGAWVQFLVRELRTCVLPGEAKKAPQNKQRQPLQEFLILYIYSNIEKHPMPGEINNGQDIHMENHKMLCKWMVILPSNIYKMKED